MRRVQRQLMTSFLGLMALSVLLVVVGEWGLLPLSFQVFGPESAGEIQFLCQTLLEIATIGVIPLALRLFKFKKVHQELVTDKEKALSKWGLLRILILFVPLLLNVLFYYASMTPGFGYMGIILFLCSFFITPTKSRCMDDVEN